MVYKSLNNLILVLLCNLIFYQIHSHSFFSCFIAFIRFLKHPRGFWIHENVPRLYHRILSSIFLHHLSCWRWLNTSLFLWVSVCSTQVPTTQLLFEHVFFLNVSIRLPLNQFTSIHVLILSPLGLLGTYLVQLPMAGFTQTEKQTRCSMRSSGSWLSEGSQNTLLRAPPATHFWKLASSHSCMHSTVPHIKPFTEPSVKTFT